MKYLYDPFICIAIIFLGNLMFKTPHKLWIYVTAFILMLFASISLNAFHIPSYAPAYLKFPEMKLEPEQVKKYMDLCDYHENKAKKALQRAEDICWWMPDLDAREKGQAFIRAIVASIGGANPATKMILSLLSFFETYTEAALGEWYELQDNLLEAHYHLEMLEFYQEVLVKA